MNQETRDDLTDVLVRAASLVLERFQAGYHPSEGELKHLEGALFPFIAEKRCGHKCIDSCDCLEEDRDDA